MASGEHNSFRHKGMLAFSKRTELKAASFEYTRLRDVANEDDYNEALIREKSLEKDIDFELYVSATHKRLSAIATSYPFDASFFCKKK